MPIDEAKVADAVAYVENARRLFRVRSATRCSETRNWPNGAPYARCEKVAGHIDWHYYGALVQQ